MKTRRREPADPLIDEIRERRERLVREHGGLRGWVDYLRELQAQHPKLVVSLNKAAKK